MDRHLLIGAVGLVRGRIRDDGKAMVSICDELETYFNASNPFDTAPFDVISFIIRYGTKSSEPEIGKINKRHSELEVAIELPMEEIRKMDYEELRETLRRVTLTALIAVADKYELNSEVWKGLQ